MQLHQLHYLQSPEGQTLLEALLTRDPDAHGGLPIINTLRKHYPAEMIGPAMTLHLVRHRARQKFDLANRMWFTRDGYEQASSQALAEHRASRFAGVVSIADLCCGIGGDAMALARIPDLESLTVADRDPVHLQMTEANLQLINSAANISGVLANVQSIDLGSPDAVFIDPARRDAHGRHATGKTEPPLDWCVSLEQRVPRIAIKLAPGLSHHQIPEGWSFETIGLRFDLKESVLWSPAWNLPTRIATVVGADGSHSFTHSTPAAAELCAPQAGQWLFDVNPAITRAGLVAELAQELELRMIDEQIAFLIGDARIGTPFAHAHQILASLPWHERSVQQAIRDADGGEVVVRRRGLPGNVDDITRRLRGSGSRSLFVAMTRKQDRPWAIICNRTLPGTGEAGLYDDRGEW